MPPILRKLLIVLFLGFPGMLLWLGGFLGLISTIAFLVADDDFHRPNGFVTIAQLVPAIGAGFLMFSTARLLTDVEPHATPARHLPAMIGYQLAAIYLGAFSCGFSLASFSLIILNRVDWTWPLAALISVSGLVAVMILQKSARAKWRADALAEGLPPGPPEGSGI